MKQSNNLEISGVYNSDCNIKIKEIDSDSIDMIITDPPYGISYQSNKQLGNTRNGVSLTTRQEHYFQQIQNDETLPTHWVSDAYRVLKNDSAMYVFLHWSKWSQLELAVRNAGFKIKAMIVINKSNHGMGDLTGGYAPKHELLMYCTKGKHKLNRIGGRKKDVIDLPVSFSGARRFHPNEKPESWIEPFILESSNPGDTVLDLFMGSGRTGICALKNHRKFIGMEIEKKYYDIAINRMHNLLI